MALDQASDIDDKQLLAAYATGDQTAARRLTLLHLPRVFAHASRLLQDHGEAEDVAQEVMMKLWKIAPNWREGEAKISTWLYRVTANACTDRLRKRRSVSLDSAPEPIDESASVEQSLMARDTSRLVHGAIAELPDRQRDALHLRHFEDLSNPEIAHALETSVEAVESLLGRARRSLAKKLAHLRPAEKLKRGAGI